MDGIDYGATGEVKRVDVSHICERLDAGSIVILSNLGSSSSGQSRLVRFLGEEGRGEATGGGDRH